jgi:competence protein ComEC
VTKSRIFLYLCLFFVLGVFVESSVIIPFVVLGIFFISGLILAAIFWTGEKKAVVIGFCLIIFAFGGYRFLQKDQAGNLSQFNGQGRLTFIGEIDDPPDRRAAGQKLKISAREVIVGGKRMNVFGLALVTAKLYPEYEYGDLLEITGQLKEPENFSSTGGSAGEFDYKSYLAKSDIYSLASYPEIKVLAKGRGSKIKSVLFWLKERFETSIEKLLPEPQAAFLAGLTLGEKRQIPESLSEAFKKTGTTHIVALSGYNISLITFFVLAILGWLLIKRNLRFWLAVLAIVFFTILTGASASVVRAAIMGVLLILARQEGRLYNIRNALVFAGAAMIYLNPKILRFDIGFQLSFLATAGLVWLAPVFEKWFGRLPKIFGLKEILIATLSAQMAVLPLLVVYFGQLSIISPIVNLIILLFIPSTMLAGFLAGGIGIIWLGAAKIFGWLAWLFLTFELAIIKFFASLPLASVKMNWGWPLAIIYYLIMIGLLYLFYDKQKKEILVEKWADEAN